MTQEPGGQMKGQEAEAVEYDEGRLVSPQEQSAVAAALPAYELNFPICEFQGTHGFLSNFHPSRILWREDGIVYPTVEHAFQAMKSENLNDRLHISGLATPGEAKRAGRTLQLREDWEDVKRVYMLQLVLEKFQNPDLAEQLTATGSRLLIEGNTWGDDYWGMVRRGGTWEGHNYLGQILMAVRMVLA